MAMTPEQQHLEQEIAELKEALRTQRQQNTLLKLWRDHLTGRHGSSGEENDGPDVMAAMLESLQYQKERLDKITGLNITEARTELLRHDEKKKLVFDTDTHRWRREPDTSLQESELSVVKRQVIDGTCGETEFQLQLELEETMNKDGDISCQIQELSISATENMYTDLGEVIERLANERNAQGFLRLLDSYEKWRTARETTLQHFVSKYPDIAESPDVKTLHLKHPTKKLAFVIDWDLAVSDIYRIVPDINLTIQVPKKVRPETNVLDVAPEKLKLMLRELGIERTFSTLVALLMKKTD